MRHYPMTVLYIATWLALTLLLEIMDLTGWA